MGSLLSAVLPAAAQDGPAIIPILASSELAQGPNRFLFSLTDREGRPLAAPDVTVRLRFYDDAADPDAVAFESGLALPLGHRGRPWTVRGGCRVPARRALGHAVRRHLPRRPQRDGAGGLRRLGDDQHTGHRRSGTCHRHAHGRGRGRRPEPHLHRPGAGGALLRTLHPRRHRGRGARPSSPSSRRPSASRPPVGRRWTRSRRSPPATPRSTSSTSSPTSCTSRTATSSRSCPRRAGCSRPRGRRPGVCARSRTWWSSMPGGLVRAKYEGAITVEELEQALAAL